jgi:hypothetical protein
VKVDHKYIEDNHVAQSYLMGKLSPEEEESFEQHYLECDECLDQLRLAESLHRGLKVVAVEEIAAKTIGSMAALSWWRRLGRWGRMSIATLVVIVAALPFVRFYSGAQQLTEPVTETALVLLSPTRSGDESAPVTRITRVTGTWYYTISLDLMFAEHEQYRIRLMNGAGDSLWRSGLVPPDEMGALVLTVPASFLEAGDYSFEVAAVLADGDERPVAMFPFLMVEPDPAEPEPKVSDIGTADVGSAGSY